MPNWIIEILMVWEYRSRSYWLLVIGLLGATFIPMIIDWHLSGIEFSGHFKALEEVFKAKAEHRVDKRSLIFLISTWYLAIKLYLKDRKKMMKRY